jgi:hypothetical protein
MIGISRSRALVTAAVLGAASFLSVAQVHAQIVTINPITPNSDDLNIDQASATIVGPNIIFKQIVIGTAGGTEPTSYVVDQLNGAAVLAYVFPTTLNSSDIGFAADEGIVALAVTDHPDFDDTPDADESGDANTHNDHGLLHAHWVVLTQDTRVGGGLAVKQLDASDMSILRPTTHPGLDLFLDSPDFDVDATGNTLTVEVPLSAINGQTDFTFDAVTAFLEVHGDADPLLGVYEAYEALGGLTLPFSVVPEPTSAAILALGLVGLGRRRLRGRRA